MVAVWGWERVMLVICFENFTEYENRIKPPQLEHHQVPLQSLWFQQDGARPHTAASTLTLLQGAFPGKVISKGGSVQWPPRFPDLSLPDFFLWGLIKAKVYQTRVQSLRALKQRIRAAVRAVPQATLKAAMDTLPLRARA